jgi:hypothetical protein
MFATSAIESSGPETAAQNLGTGIGSARAAREEHRRHEMIGELRL